MVSNIISHIPLVDAIIPGVPLKIYFWFTQPIQFYKPSMTNSFENILHFNAYSQLAVEHFLTISSRYLADIFFTYKKT